MSTSLDPNSPVDLVTLARTGKPTRKIYIETYGCQMNVADSELMAGVMGKSGWSIATSAEEADVILVNTCAVREKAEERVLGRARTLNGIKNYRPDVLIGITGCMAEHLRETLAERAPYVDLIIGPDAYRRLPELIEQAEDDSRDPIIDVRLDRDEVYEGLNPVRKEGVSGFVTIQRGCDKFCTFCVVPYTRGRERGVPPREVLRQVRELAAEGFSEVTLLGQTVNSYVYEDVDFADLVRAVAQLEGIERIRFTSPYPIDFTPKLIEVIATEPKVCNYIHLPVQSGSDPVLERMRRGYTIGEYRKLVADIRAAVPSIAISTDIIVGFPGETDADYQLTVELLDEMRYDFAFLFKYSERSGTFAHKRLADDIPESVKGARLAAIIKQQEAIGAEVIKRYLGQTLAVMLSGDSKRSDAHWVGRTDTFVSTIVPKIEGVKPGQIVDVLIDDHTSHTLFGTIIR